MLILKFNLCVYNCQLLLKTFNLSLIFQVYDVLVMNHWNINKSTSAIVTKLLFILYTIK